MLLVRDIDKEQGFTMVELLIYMGMFVLVLGVIYTVLTTNTRSYSSQENKVEMVQDLRASMELITTEIRMAGCDPTGIGGVGFADNANDNYDTDRYSIHFEMDADESGAIGLSDEDINYYLNGSQQIIRRMGDGTESVVAENITGLEFVYTFADGETDWPDETDADNTNDLDDIRAVRVSLTGRTAKVDPITGDWRTKTPTSWVVVRNAGLE